MGVSFAVMSACHDFEANRRLRISVKGRDEMIWSCSSLGNAMNSWSKGMLKEDKKITLVSNQDSWKIPADDERIKIWGENDEPFPRRLRRGS